MFDKIDDILELVQDFDFEKVKETVDAVWDQKDEIGQVVEFVVENKDKIVDVITQLPKLLDKTGAGIAAAGESAVKASALLTGDGSESAVSGLTDLAAGALDRCRKQLAAALRPSRPLVSSASITAQEHKVVVALVKHPDGGFRLVGDDAANPFPRQNLEYEPCQLIAAVDY